MTGIGSRAAEAPDSAALVAARTLTYGELNDRQLRLAGAFDSGDLVVGDRVAVYSKNRIEHVEVCSGALRAGIIPVPINPLLTEREVAYVMEDSGARWLFSDRGIDSPSPERIVTFGDAYERLIHDAKPRAIADAVLGRPMHYTSGTTGDPKGVFAPLSTETRAQELSDSFCNLWGLSSDDVHLVCSPLSHSAPLRFAIRSLEAGGTVVLQSKFEAAETLAAIELFGATSTFMVPTHLERIIDLGPTALNRHDLSSLRLLAHAGAPIRPETKDGVIELFPPNSVWEFYGATEGQATRISATEWLRKRGSVGTVLPGGRIHIRSEDGRPLPSGETGVVWIKDPDEVQWVYWEDPEKTARAWKNNSFNVGDLGYLDPDNYLYLVGRLYDTIITGGINVYAQEVEAVLITHPAVAEVAVYGAPHDEWGQEVCALVVVAPGLPLDPELLKSWARERLAGFKCPRRIDIVDELPRTATGKILRRNPE
jgi:long-chain acyl-CoA synthetase